ncbi:MAG: carboxypeptidase-like regulatory domain-containing protein, partial [Opitutaceae bacterium]
MLPARLAAAEGGLEGRVLNARSGEYLGNARVTVTGGALEAFTDADGRYRFPRLPAGRVEIRATFTGLPPATGVTEVVAGRTAVFDLSLGAPGGGTVRLDQFVVGASREMDAAALAINEQRHAPNVRQVVATDEFGHVAEGNVGE